MITVILATRDRCETLQQTLDALRGIRAPHGGWKLVVVDNGSRDATRAMLDRYATVLPLTAVDEPMAGKSRALNRAVPHIEGDLVVLTDDDVIPDIDWLVRLEQAAAAQPEATIFGGTVVPLWPGARPAAISKWAVDFAILFAENLRPTGWCIPQQIFGVNMAVRSRVFQDGFRFSEDVGPNNAQRAYAMGNDFDFMRRLAETGHRAWFVAEARVKHIIRKEQLTEDWVLRRYYLHGLGIQRAGWARGPRGLAKRVFWQACAAVARRMPPSQLRLRILSRNEVFAGAFGVHSPVLDAARPPRRLSA